MATLNVNSSTNFTGRFLALVDIVDFTNPSSTDVTAIFGGWQFAPGQISPYVLFDGSAGINEIVVNCNIKGLDASGWSFANWNGSDRVYINGTAFSDTITGSSRGDTIFAFNGSDTIDGGKGADTISGGAGPDTLSGGEGRDTLSYEGSSSGVIVDLATSRTSGGDALGDRIGGFENVTGSEGSDQLTGDGGANEFDGQAGSDRLIGGGGNDTLKGGLGQDVLTGGTGADSFVYTSVTQSPVGGGHDLITDFRHGEHDVIDVSAIDAVPGGGDSAFVFIGTADFSAAGQLRYFHDGGQTIIEADRNGDGTADMEIALTGNLNLVAGDFIL